MGPPDLVLPEPATMLLIPCANIAGIMLARAVTRRREISTRLAMGAWRGRIVRQLLTEGVLLSSIAGVLGVVVCHITFLVLRDSAGAGPVVADVRVLLYSAGLCLVTTLGFALAPALRATRIDLASTMRDGATGGFGRSHLTAGKVLTAVQVVLASLLLIGTAVQVRTLVEAMAPRGVAPERVTLIVADFGTRDRAVTDVRRTLDQLGNLPGVEVASAVGGGGLGAVICEGDIPAGPEAVLNIVAPGFLRSTGIPLTAGRDIRWDDEDAAVINQSLARRLYGTTDPIGRTVRVSECQERMTIVGVVADSNNAIGPDFYRDGNGTVPTMYVPLSSGVVGFPLRSVRYYVRAGAAPVAPDTMVIPVPPPMAFRGACRDRRAAS